MRGLPEDAFDTLVSVVARICEDPYDRLVSKPTAVDGRMRVAELDDGGFIEFMVDDAARQVLILRFVWTG